MASREFLFMDTSPEPTEPDEETVNEPQGGPDAPSPDRWRMVIDSNLTIEPGGDIGDTPAPQRQADTY